MATAPTGTLRRGSSGTGVRQLQEALVNLGLLDADQVDGQFGPRTEAAVQDFQEGAGLRADGVYGPDTRAALEKRLGSGGSAAPKPAPARGHLGAVVLGAVAATGLALLVAAWASGRT